MPFAAGAGVSPAGRGCDKGLRPFFLFLIHLICAVQNVHLQLPAIITNYSVCEDRGAWYRKYMRAPPPILTRACHPGGLRDCGCMGKFIVYNV